MTDTCKTCLFYVPDWEHEGVSAVSAALGMRSSAWYVGKGNGDTLASHGRCRKGPPSGRQGFPQVDELAYCFEWDTTASQCIRIGDDA